MPTRTLVRARPRLPVKPPMQSIVGEYGGSLWNLINGLPADDVRLPVNEQTVSGLVGCWAATQRIANAVAPMMAAADALDGNGNELEPTPTVLADPCAGYEATSYWKEAVLSVLLHGNWVGLRLDPDPVTGYPRQVLPVPPGSVHAYWNGDGEAVYEIASEHFTPDDVVHVRYGLSVPGQIMAIGVVEAHRRGLGAHLDLQSMAGSVWRQGGVPSGIVQLDTPSPTQEQVSIVKSSWMGAIGGKRTVAVTGSKMSYQPVSWSASDAEFLASRQFSIAEAALLWGLRPEDLGSSFGASSGAVTYGNRSDDALQRITDSYMPVAVGFEEAWSRLLPGRNCVRADVEALMRSTPRERIELLKLKLDAGLITLDEARAEEGLPPLPPKPAPPAPPPVPASIITDAGTPPALDPTTQEVVA